MPNYSLKLEKTSLRRLNEGVIKDNIDGIISRALGGNRHKHWTCEGWKIPQPILRELQFLYTVKLNFKKKKPGDAETDEQEFAHLADMANGACSGNGRWVIVDGLDSNRIKVVREQKEVGKLNTNLGHHFSQIFDRTAQIQIIHSALVAFEESKQLNRYHACLFGPPGSGKTEILLSVAEMLGEDAVLKLDMTNTTSAGINKLLLELSILPKVIICEELEKQNENLLTWLLGLLDQRGEIRKTNYRIGTQSRQVNALVFATVNNMNLFNSVMSGALSSRFPNKIYCPRPSLHVLRKILLREVRRVNGNEEWIEPTIKYCQEHNIDDPREASTICLCGRDKLLTGKYQEYLLATRMPE